MRTTIYGLTDANGQLRYVGKTSKRLTVRLNGHIQDARCGKAGHRCHWIRAMLRDGSPPRMAVLTECEGDGSAEERFLISLARYIGIRLVNDTDGGEGMTGFRQPPHVRAAVSKAQKGKPKSPETRAKIGAAQAGRPKPRAQIEAMRQSMQKHWTGAAWAERQHRATVAAAEANRGKRRPADVIERGAAKRRGRKVSEAERLRLASYNVNRVVSDETRAKLSAAKKGKPKSAATRLRMSEASRRRPRLPNGQYPPKLTA